jgi:microcystin degradation protein MlrC
MKTGNIHRRNFLSTLGASALAAGTVSAQTAKPRSARTGKKRIMIGSFSHETNTFNPNRTGVDAFKRSAQYGDEVWKRERGCIGGFMEALGKSGLDVETVGSVAAWADGGMVSDEAFEWGLGIMLDILEKKPSDAVYLNLHGAGATDSHPDLEGDLIERIRKKVGPGVPIMITVDLHATLTPLWAKAADAVSVYRTYPHVDTQECGREIAWTMVKTLRGELRPVCAVKKIPLLIGPPLNVLPTEMPMKLTYDRAREMERTLFGALIACPAQGFMQQDVPDCGAGAVVTVNRDRALAQKMADELGEIMFAHRKEYWIHLPDAAEAVRLAMTTVQPPVAISDGGDNIGAGTPGDGTELLREILKQGVDSAFVMLWDPETAQKAVRVAVGANLTLDVGGRSDPLYGPPVAITGTLVSKIGAPGGNDVSARIDVKGASIVVNSLRRGPSDLERPKELGIDPAKYRMTVCKGGFAFRTAYRPDTYRYIMAETPGYASTNLKQFPYKKIKRPIYPLDEM